MPPPVGAMTGMAVHTQYSVVWKVFIPDRGASHCKDCSDYLWRRVLRVAIVRSQF